MFMYVTFCYMYVIFKIFLLKKKNNNTNNNVTNFKNRYLKKMIKLLRNTELFLCFIIFYHIF